MPEQENPPQLLVSVQDARAADAVAGHLAWGRMTHTDYVVVAGPPDWLEEGVRPEVLLSVAPPSAPGSIQRITVSGIERHGIRDRDDLQFTGVRLAHPCTLPVVSLCPGETLRRPIHSVEQLRTALEAITGPPAGTGTAGTGTAGVGAAAVQELLAPVVAAEKRPGGELYEDLTVEESLFTGPASPAEPPRMRFVCWVLGLDGCR